MGDLIKRKRDGAYNVEETTSVKKLWKQARQQELKSRIFATKNELRNTDLKIAALQQEKEDNEFGKKPDLEGHIEMLELELEELKISIDV